MKKLLAITTFLFLLIALNLHAQEVSTEGFKPNKLRPKAIASYTIKISNLEGTADLNDISAKLPKGLKLLDQEQQNFNNMSWENGVSKRESGINLTLSFSADEEGTYTIGAWNAKVGDKLYPVGAHTLIVDANAPVYVENNSPFGSTSPFGLDPFARMQQMMGGTQSRFNNQRQQAERVDLSGLVEAKISIGKGKVFVGESIPCQIILEVDKSLQSRAQIELSQLIAQPLDTNAFTCQDLPEKPSLNTSNPEKNIYIYETVITPNKVGTYPLSYKIQGAFGGRSFFSSSYRFDEDAKLEAIEVNALPRENVPASFSGAIGEFKISNVKIEPSSACVGDLLTLSFSVEGVGNFDRISAPALASNAEWKIYEPTSEFADKSAMSFVGTKTFNYRMVAQKPDLEYALSPEFSYFNPVKEEYLSLAIPAQKVSISPAARINSIVANKAPTQSGKFDIISESQALEEASVSLLARAEFWICQLMIILLLLLVILYRRKILFLRANPALVKKSKETRAAKIHLKFAKKYAYENATKPFFESALKAIQFSLSRTEEIQAESITLKDAKKLLEKNGKVLPNIEDFFYGLDSLSYSASKAQSFDLIQLEKSLRDLCKELLR